MIICPKCGAESSVYDSRPFQGTVKRRRRCDACSEKWTTFEVSRAPLLPIRSLSSTLAALAEGKRHFDAIAAELSDFSAGVADLGKLTVGAGGSSKKKRQLKPGASA